MLRQISSVVEDEVSEMAQPDVTSTSPQQSQSEYVSLLIGKLLSFSFVC